MSERRYAIGVDFGTESGRALLVDVADGREVATYVHPYANGVIDERLPKDAGGQRLPPDWALQDPNDYIEVYKHAVPAVLRESGVRPEEVIGLGIDFTACTMLPVKADGTPLCAPIVEAAQRMARLRDESYAPNPAAKAVYDRLFAEYVTLPDYFGRGANDVMKRLKALKAKIRGA